MSKKKLFTVRLLALALALITALSAGTMLTFAAEDVTYVNAYSDMWGSKVSTYPCDDESDVMASRMYINGSFSSLKATVATYHRTDSSVTAQVFKWDKNYNRTIEGTPIYEHRFENIADNGTLTLELGQTCEAGDYLVVFKDPRGQKNLNGDTYGYFTVYCRSMNKVGLGCVYINGVEQLFDMYLQVGFVGEVPAEPFKAAITFQDVKPDFETSIANSNGQQDYWDIGGETKVVGQRVKVSAPIEGFAFSTPTWGNSNCSVELAAYKWNETFEKTVAVEPFAKGTATGIKDNASNWLIFDEAVPAGEYLFTIRQTSGLRVAIYFYTTNPSGGYVYVDGTEFRNDLLFTVRFQNKLEAGQEPFLPCDGEASTSDGTVTLPEPWEPAEDSLINTHKVQPTTWVFTDGLGRESWEYGENGVGAVNEDKVLAIFYWNWHLRFRDNSEAFNIQRFIEQYPEAKNNVSHPGWNDGKQYYWNESIFGYYDTRDPWVLRRHAELLANASIDTVFTDNTNNVMTFRNGYLAMYEEWTKAQNNGVNTPKISFHLPMWYAPNNPNEYWWTSEQIEYLYMDIYRRGQYENLWFWFDGKPMVIARLDGNENLQNSDDPLYKEILSFFASRAGVSSYRDMEIRSDDGRIGSWGWLSKYPQATYFANKSDARKGTVEQMTVGIAQNHDFKNNDLTAMNGPRAMGRSYTSDNNTRYHDSQKNEVSETTKWGYNFEEQWNYALEVDPKVVFITGWNEWTVSRRASWVGVSNAFGDQFNDEYSRDIEPTKGALKDYYYYQLINYTRKFKGAEEMPVPTIKATIDLSKGLEAQWEGVGPYFAAYIGNTMDRDSYGRVVSAPYRDFSGRNDIIGAQIARDDEYVYFNVECNDDITPYTDKLWMNLYIDVDQTNKGWETFDYVVNKTAASKTTSVLEKFTGEGYTSEKVADVEYKVDGKFMTIKIAKSDLGLKGDDYTINFAWTDNVHDSDDKGAVSKNGWVYSDFSGDIMDFYTSGDVAPGARFKFSYISTAKNSVPPVIEPETTPSETTKPIEPTTTAPTTTPADTETSEPATTPAGTETPAPATTTAAPATTNAPSTTTAAPETTTEAAGGCGGCGSTVIGSAAAIAMIAMAGAAAVVLKKKKEDEK